MAAEPATDRFGHGQHMAGPAPLRKPHVAAVCGLPQRDLRTDFRRCGQRRGGHERVVAGIEQQGWNADAPQMGLGGRAAPVVFGVAEAMHRTGEHIVERVQVTGGAHRVARKQARVLGQLGQRFGLHAVQEHAVVHQPVEAAANGVPTGRQVQRRTHGGHSGGHLRSGVAGFGGPAHQRVAAEGNTHHQQRAATALVLPGAETLQDPADFFKVTGMVGARREVEFAAAAPEMRHGKRPSRAWRARSAKACE